jgi:hypothetical protein
LLNLVGGFTAHHFFVPSQNNNPDAPLSDRMLLKLRQWE